MTGLYYYEQRFYNPKGSLFLSVDPMAEKTMNSYAYCSNNPIMRIDPDGLTDYTIDKTGNITQQKSGMDYKYDRLFTASGYADRTGKPLIINDRNLLLQFSNRENVAIYEYETGEILLGVVGNSEYKSDTYKLFRFAAENTNIEWSFQEYTDGTTATSTAGQNTTTTSGKNHQSNSGKAVSIDIHSHPSDTPDDFNVNNGTDVDRKNAFITKNPNAKVLLYMPKAENPSARMFDITNSEWLTNY